MHLSAALQRMRFDMNIRNEFLDSIKNMYPLAFELAVIAGEIIEENFSLGHKKMKSVSWRCILDSIGKKGA